MGGGSHDTAVKEFGYQPALDGVRGLAVAAVLGFHLGIGWMSGGYLGVSVFFTLSGFLITSLLLGEHRRHGVVDLPGFYQRRARRLIPAGLLVLALVCLAVAMHWLSARSTFRRDVVASMVQSLNWVHLFGHQSYADLFTAPSPVTHFWSLGVEEQFYVVWPLMLVLVLRFLHRRAIPQRLLAVVVGLWVVTAVSAPVTARLWSSDAAYYATWARASEVFVGASLAVWLTRHRPPAWWRWLAPLAVAVMAVLVVVTPAGRGWAFEGGLPLFGVVSVALVAGLQVPGIATRLLSWRPLVWLGTVSYGVYLFHWPVFLALDEDRTGLHGPALVALRLAVTVALAEVSYVLLEHPIRVRRVVPSARSLTAALGAAVAVVAVLAVVVVDVPAPVRAAPAPDLIVATSPSVSPSTPTTAASAGSGDQGTAPAESSGGVPAPSGHVLAVFGDSVPAWLLRDGAKGFAHPDVLLVNGAREACDALPDMPPARDRFGAELLPPADCRPWTTWYPEVLDTIAPRTGHTVDTAVLVLGQAPVLDHKVDGAWVAPCESIDWYLTDIGRRVDFLRGRGLDVVFVLPAQLGSHVVFSVPDDFRRRMGCVRAALIPYLAGKGVPTVDMDPELCPEGDCEAVRTRDGVHVDPDKAPAVLNWMIEQVMRARG